MSEQPATASASEIMWDYKTVVLTLGTLGITRGEMDRPRFEVSLDELGRDGYELIWVFMDQVAARGRGNPSLLLDCRRAAGSRTHLRLGGQVAVNRLPDQVADRPILLVGESLELLALLARHLCGDDDLGFYKRESHGFSLYNVADV